MNGIDYESRITQLGAYKAALEESLEAVVKPFGEDGVLTVSQATEQMAITTGKANWAGEACNDLRRYLEEDS